MLARSRKDSPSQNRAFLFLALAFLVQSLGCTPSEEDAEPRSRLVLIGVDSGSWTLFDPWIEAGEMPHLQALRDRGYAADLETVAPLISPPNWTSIATGKKPEAHGVPSFFGDRRHVRVPTVWERLTAAGLRVGVYDYLVTWPPRSLPGGVVVPSWLRRDDRLHPVGRTLCYPRRVRASSRASLLETLMYLRR